MKNNRQKVILELINRRSIETQDDILDALHELGYKVTQATVSRDMKELQITKTVGDNGAYRYSASSTAAAHQEPRHISILRETVVNVDFAGNIVVFKTHVGMANAAAVAVESLTASFAESQKGEILGCIAGDDTIFMLIRTEVAARVLAAKLRETAGI